MLDDSLVIARWAPWIVLVLGCMIGSFLNVVIYRLPLQRSVVWPGSSCPHCKTAIRPSDNIPVLSWLWLQGRCRSCQEPISPRYPLIEATTGLLFLASYFIWGLSWHWAVAALFLAILMAVFWIDVDTMLILDVITYPALALGLAVQYGLRGDQTAAAAGLAVTVGAVLMTRWAARWPYEETPEADIPAGDRQLARLYGLFFPVVLAGFAVYDWATIGQLTPATTGALAGLLFFELIYRSSPFLLRLLGVKTHSSGMGYGDVKLASVLGAWLGPVGLVVALYTAFVVGAIVGLVLKHVWHGGESRPFPFGPAMVIGGVASLYWGPAMWQWYWQLLTR